VLGPDGWLGYDENAVYVETEGSKRSPSPHQERKFFIDNLLVRIHLIIVMI
jgi:hypothetical protein